MNEKFGQLINGNLVYAPKPLVIDGVKIYTNDASIYAQQDWYLIINTVAPDDAEKYTYYWAVDDETQTITQTWIEIGQPIDPSTILTMRERLENLETTVDEISRSTSKTNEQVEVVSDAVDVILMDII